MLKTRIKSIRISIIILFLIIIAISVNLLDTNQTTVNGLVLGLLQTSIYIFLYAIWGVSVQLRISQTQARFFLQLIASLLIFWILLRGMKYYIFAEGSHICRYLWYLYYVPMLLIPLLSFFVGLSLGKPDYHRIPRWNILLFTICIILIIGVLTNDIHRLAFTFSNENLEYADSEHGFGFIYFLIYIWMLCLPAAFLFIVISKCRIPGIKKVLWLPIVPFIVAFIYSLCYNFKILRVFTDMNLVFTATIVAIFECCIKCGLIRTNTGYIELFEAGSYGAQIINKNFMIIHDRIRVKFYIKKHDGRILDMEMNSRNRYFKKEITLSKEEEIKIVKIGFSWVTFFFGFLVPFYRKDWNTGWMLLTIMVISHMMLPLLMFLILVVFSFLYNRIYINMLLKSGWRFTTKDDERLWENKKEMAEKVDNMVLTVKEMEAKIDKKIEEHGFVKKFSWGGIYALAIGILIKNTPLLAVGIVFFVISFIKRQKM